MYRETSRLLIRPLESTDTEALCEAVLESQESINRWMEWARNYDLNAAQNFIEHCTQERLNETSYELGLFDNLSGKLLGCIGINGIQKQYQMGNLGYWVRSSQQGQGIASEAVHAIAKFGFELGLTRLEIVVMVDNIASRKVAEHVNAIFECIAQNRLVLDGQPMAAAIYSLLPR